MGFETPVKVCVVQAISTLNKNLIFDPHNYECRLIGMIFVMPSNLVGRRNSCLPNCDSKLPNNVICQKSGYQLNITYLPNLANSYLPKLNSYLPNGSLVGILNRPGGGHLYHFDNMCAALQAVICVI